MKRHNFFKSAGTFLVAGVFATTFAACDSSSDRSTVDGAEEIVETEQTTTNDPSANINEPTVGYENGEYNSTGTSGTYDVNQQYTYEDRELVRNRLREDIDRADRSLERMGNEAETAGENAAAETKQEREKARETLQRERDRLSQRLEEVENATEENWERVSNDVNSTLRDWEKEWEELRTKNIDIDVDVNERGTTTNSIDQ